jgi:hypothetical protein
MVKDSNVPEDAKAPAKMKRKAYNLRTKVAVMAIARDRELARLPHRIETDRLARILMTAPPFFEHVSRASRIIVE